MLWVPPDKREQERGSRQQDLREQGLSKGGTTGGTVGASRTTTNQQPPTKSVFINNVVGVYVNEVGLVII